MKKAIYKITNLINGKCYIGQSVHPDKRYWQHCNAAKYQIDNYPIHNAIHKYGENNFSFEILEWTEDFDNRERELIQYYNSLFPNGYNISKGGPSPIMIGEDNFKNKVPTAIIQLIINDLKQNKMSDREISKKYGLTDKIIADINHGYSHKIDWQTYPIRIKKGRQKLTEEEADGIKNDLLNSTLTFSEIAEKFNTTKSNISQINQGRNFRRDKDIYPIRKNPIKVNQFG